MLQTCDRCNTNFQCQPEAIAHCQCYAWQLTPATRALIATQYTNCLCASCLQQLGAVAKNTSFAPTKKPPERD